jgi:MFS family permease
VPNPYRFSPDFIQRWERRLKRIIWIGFGAGAVLVLVALGLGGAFDGRVSDEDPLWLAVWGFLWAGVVVAGLAILLPLLIACLLGGLAIHRYGWAPGLLTYIGILGTAAGGILGEWLVYAGIGTLVVGVLGFFLVGRLAKVPMSIGPFRVDSD